MSRYIPQPAYPEKMPVDISSVFEDEKPAGKHGFLHVAGEEFRFADGTPARFWGVNLNGSACFPTREEAERTAQRLAQSGCNMVRFHQLDAEWDTPNIYGLTKGKRLTTTRKLDEAAMDRLDYLIHCLKEQGIYFYLDLLTYRHFKEEDGVQDLHLLSDAAKPWCVVDQHLIDLQKEFCTQIWCHYNPYTGLAYKDDPAFVLTEAVNECTLFIDLIGPKWDGYECPYYMNQFRQRFRAYLEEKGIEYDWEHCDFFAPDKPMIDFKIEISKDYYRQMYEHLRSIGVKIPITGTNLTHTAACIKSHEDMDFTDSHHYYYDWKWGNQERICMNKACTESPYIFADMAKMKTVGKPFFVSEWDVPWPNSFRAEGPIYYAAVGALQGWSGFTIHTYAYTSTLDRMDVLGKELSSPVAGMPHREGVFATWNDPAKFGLFYHAALITRRQDVSPANKKVAVQAKELGKTVHTAFQGLLEQHVASTCFTDELPQGYDQLVSEEEVYASPNPDLLVSDNGQLWRDLRRKIGAIDTPRTKVLYGFMGRLHSNLSVHKHRNGVVELDGLSVDCKTDFAVIAMSSLTDDPICDSRNILISAIGRARNTDAQFDGDKMLQVGNPPIQAEVIEAQIKLKTSRGDRLKVWGVNPEGFYAGKMHSVYEDGVLTFQIGDEMNPACYYLVVED